MNTERKILEEKIKKLKEVEKYLTENKLRAEDLSFIYNRVSNTGNIWHAKIDSFQHFYIGNPKEILIFAEELRAYEKSICRVDENFHGHSVTVCYKGKEGYGAGVFLSEERKLIPVFEPTFASVSRVWTNFVTLRDNRKKLYQSLVTLKGDVYKIKEKSKYIDDFTVGKCRVYANSSSPYVNILYYKGIPVYMEPYTFMNKEEIYRFMDGMDKHFADDFNKLAAIFDDRLLKGEFGPQKIKKS